MYIIGSLCSLFLFVAMQKERVNRERKTRYLFAILRIAQALTGALRAVLAFPHPLRAGGRISTRALRVLEIQGAGYSLKSLTAPIITARSCYTAQIPR